MTSLHILITDDHCLFRKGVIAALTNLRPTWKFYEAENGQEALTLVNSNDSPDIVLLDVSMPIMGGIETAKKLKQAHPGLPIIMISQFDQNSLILHVIQLGVNGYLLKSTKPESVVDAIEIVMRSGKYITPRMKEVLENSIGNNPHMTVRFDLSNRDKEILDFLRQGKSTKEIALQMHLTETSIESYRKDLLSKTRTRNVAELISFAHRVGLLSLTS